MQFTRILSGPSDAASACVSATIPPLEAAYASEFGSDIIARVEAMLTMQPPPFRRMCLAAAREHRKVPYRFVRSTVSQSASFSWYGDFGRPMPALLIRI